MLQSVCILLCYRVAVSSCVTEWLYPPVLQSGCILLCYRTAVASCVTEWLYPPVLQNGCSLLRYRVAVPICVTEWLYPSALQSGCTHLCYRVAVPICVTEWLYLSALQSVCVCVTGSPVQADSDGRPVGDSLRTRRQHDSQGFGRSSPADGERHRDTGEYVLPTSQPPSVPVSQTAINACR